MQLKPVPIVDDISPEDFKRNYFSVPITCCNKKFCKAMVSLYKMELGLFQRNCW